MVDFRCAVCGHELRGALVGIGPGWLWRLCCDQETYGPCDECGFLTSVNAVEPRVWAFSPEAAQYVNVD